MKNFLAHFLFPRFSNNQRAKLIHSQIIFLVAFLLVGTSFFAQTIHKTYPSVLGASVDVAAQQLLDLTNQDRSNAGLPPLQLNAELTQAAAGKAQDMFAKNYWAHFSPTGTSPWDFIRAAGYNYVYAGENLAKGFYTSSDVVNAWMASPDHRANMLSPNYTDVGFAIQQGSLTGDSNTVLVVEMFGSQSLGHTANVPPVVTLAPTIAITQAPVAPGKIARAISPTPTPTQVPVLAAVKNAPIFNSAFYTKAISLSLISLFLLIFGLDVVMTESRQTIRLAGHSFDHLLFLIGILIIAITLGLGIVG